MNGSGACTAANGALVCRSGICGANGLCAASASSATTSGTTAGFINPAQYSTPLLTVGTTGCGSVSPAGLPATASVGAQVSFTANPCAGHSFLGWTGGPCAGTSANSCMLTILTGTIAPMTANFSP